MVLIEWILTGTDQIGAGGFIGSRLWPGWIKFHRINIKHVSRLEGLIKGAENGLAFTIVCLQMEPLPSGNLPPGFDPSTCRSVYAGNIHTQVTEVLLQEIFAITGPIESCKLIRKDKSSYGFVHYFDRRSTEGICLDSLSKLIGPTPLVKGKIHLVISTFLLEISVQRSLMQHCLKASLPTTLARCSNCHK
ncbi:unnamed protein product [Microthlaspi erraticum]|uniref:RRM domain-containing protein n=1 Tax=Microthlaspi erraticum TaxID=1685480 RepID=A0A6D2JFE3_9BRAS|nr:unnamed protein product [Microthlaspi erraticum]